MMSSGQEETELTSEEVKESRSRSSIIWTAVISFVTGVLVSFVTIILSYGLKYVFDPSEKRILTVTENQTENLLNLDQKVYDEIITTYTLRNRPSESVKSYFRYSATIHNTGDIGVEKLKVFVHVDNSDVILAKTPSITTTPPDIHRGIILQQNKQVVETSEDEWEVSLLNPHESITFAYIGYSTKEVNNALFKLVPRKKDWAVIREGAKTLSEGSPFFDKTNTETREETLFELFPIVISIVSACLALLVLLFSQRYRALFERRSIRDDAGNPKNSI